MRHGLRLLVLRSSRARVSPDGSGDTPGGRRRNRDGRRGGSPRRAQLAPPARVAATAREAALVAARRAWAGPRVPRGRPARPGRQARAARWARRARPAQHGGRLGRDGMAGASGSTGAARRRPGRARGHRRRRRCFGPRWRPGGGGAGGRGGASGAGGAAGSGGGRQRWLGHRDAESWMWQGADADEREPHHSEQWPEPQLHPSNPRQLRQQPRLPLDLRVPLGRRNDAGHRRRRDQWGRLVVLRAQGAGEQRHDLRRSPGHQQRLGQFRRPRREVHRRHDQAHRRRSLRGHDAGLRAWVSATAAR